MNDFWEQDKPAENSARRHRIVLVRVVAGVAVAGLVGAAAWGVFKMLSGEKSTRKQVVQIALMAPPPPPPPPPPQVKPPEPEVKNEVKIDEPKPDPIPEADAPPPGEQLGLDSDGSGPGDGFGLAARKGGRDITDDTIGGGKGNRSQFAWFNGQVQGFLQDQFLKNEKLRSAEYRVVLRLWFDSDGRVERYELVNGSGNGEIDQTLKSAMAELPRMKVAVPADLPQPLHIRITSRGAG
jgi:protein TonB